MTTLVGENSQIIQFRRLNISIEIVRSGDITTDINVEAPEGLFEGEFEPSSWTMTSCDGLSAEELSRRRHDICNHLHTAGMSLDILARRTEAGETATVGRSGDGNDLEPILQIAVESLSELERLATTNVENQSA
ncbi:hypothetical protein Pla22_14130 [Rubripirellula amarantea]|uniref:Uncharacterized protein n=1 Tax=Rubripirellula amarantea TaxID=2527999 RepID=A0A5C5WTE7_9BACT|nr:hypothetical protein [Rubripirellula amarantea]TWT53780.1 hypothetical protein Pla22_14130 [Rubripirellula amarantea]